MWAAASIAPALLNRMPRRAPSPVPTITAIGVASPSASGQVMTTTVMANSIASCAVAPAASQPKKVRVPPIRATRTSQNAARSASRCPGALEFCACCTIWTICASAVSAPTLVARARRDPVVFTEAPMSSDPTCLGTGRLSPVTIDSSISDSPNVTTASTGTLAPGRMRRVSPTTTSAVGSSIGSPSRSTVARGGASSSSVRTASLAPPRARISSQWPRRTNAVRTVAAS